MRRPFDRFILLAEMRTGSNFLEENLNALAGLTCHGEAFNPHFIGKKDRAEYLGVTFEAREADPLALMRRMEEETEGLSGFRFFHDHDPRVLAACLPDPRCAKIVLTRNPLESYVSLKIAQATGQWKLGDARRRRAARAVFDGAEFEAHLAALQAFQLRVLRALQTTGQTAFYIDYDDIQDVAVLNGLAAWLGVPGRLDAVVETIKKQNPEPLADLVENPADMEAALARVDRFNLARTPNFEPRRGPSVPALIAAAGAPALFLPIPGGPEAAVVDWLDRLARPGAGGGVLGRFTQKTLRQWLREAAGSRTFTVLRHPLDRAHAAFCDRILSGATPEVRQSLRKAYKIDLPPADKLHRQDAAGHQAAFLGFLRFLRGNLAGQTAVRVDAHWATQSAVLQGYGAVVSPDLVLREERLAEGLAFLAAELGAAAPPLAPPPPDDRPHALAAIWTPEIEAAAREAYARDYQTFGFGDWRPRG